MKKFMDNDFLLTNEIAEKLYNDYAKNLPIIDYHCHIPAEEIAKNISFENITKLWLGADHYKWRFMRSCGVSEELITGNAPDKEKFCAFAKCLSKAIGNPLFAWSHMELKRYFGFEDILCEDNAEEVYELCNNVLSSPSMTARSIIINSNVSVICTTDDPADSLEWHQQIKDDNTFDVKVLPSFRPDNAFEIAKNNYTDYLDKLSKASGILINNLASLKSALSKRLEIFVSTGCKVTDHGLSRAVYRPCDDKEADLILSKRLSGSSLCIEEEEKFKTNILLYLGRLYKKHNLVMQIHYGCKRDNNQKMLEKIGINTGFDCIGSDTGCNELTDFLNALDYTDELPKTILYSLNPSDNQAIDSIIGCFQCDDAIMKVQHGSAWWFNDNRIEMERHLACLANQSYLAGFVGMLTDSRSFLSYTRHEYFRRILCNYIGTLVENGEYPYNESLLGEIVSGISYFNAEKYFSILS